MVSGKVKAVTRTTGSTLQLLEFAYGPKIAQVFGVCRR